MGSQGGSTKEGTERTVVAVNQDARNWDASLWVRRMRMRMGTEQWIETQDPRPKLTGRFGDGINLGAVQPCEKILDMGSRRAEGVEMDRKEMDFCKRDTGGQNQIHCSGTP